MDDGVNYTMSQQQPSSPKIPSPSYLSNSVLEVMSINPLPDVLKSLENLTAGDNLQEGNQSPTDKSKEAKPQGIVDEEKSGFNTKQLITIEPTELENERKATEEEKSVNKKCKEARIDVNPLAKQVDDSEELLYKKNVNADSLKLLMAKKYSCDTKTFYLNYVKDGRILNAEKYNHEMKKYMASSSNKKLRYRKCVCPYCQESGIETIGRSNYLLDHMRRTQKIKIQCVYCNKFFNVYQRVKDHVRKYHWKLGENIPREKENPKE